MPRQARENTLASFALALAAGANGIELDVHATADGVVVVHHDATLEDGAAIDSLTLEELRERVSVAEWLPTLREVCALVKGRAELFVEIKGDDIERLVTEALDAYHGASAIHSFDHSLIQRLASSGTSYRLGILLEENVANVRETMLQCGALDAWPFHPLVTRDLVHDVHDARGRVIAWTVNDQPDAKRLALLGVDGICTDDVSLLATL